MVLVLFAAGSGGIAAQSTGATIAEKREFFESRIRPVLVEHCYTCHNASVRHESDLAVDSRDGLLAGGDGGAVLVPGKPAESRLLLTMRHQIADLEMPEGQAKLSPEVLVDFEKWIAEGAYDPRDDAPTEKALSAATSWESTFQRRKDWWCYQPISNPDPPDVADPKWNHHAIDRFLASRWAAEGLSPSDPASAEVLIRRLFINLIGLPPSMEEFQTWTQRIGVEDSIQKRRAMEELVDHLLQRPQFGERWARHWMDWIRYADSHGSEGDPEILGAWQYRDYLIRAINQDVPVDQLMIEHVAGDLLEQPRVNVQRGWNESIIGTAHWRMVFHGFAPTDALDEKVRFVDDQINAFSKAFLGQTVSCARCHDHKFDAIGQQDYYALFSVLAACRPGRNVVDLPSQWNQRRQELKAIKPKIREALANDWLEALPQLRRRLQSVTPERKDAEANDHLLHLLFLHPATTGDTGQVAEKISTENTNGKPDVDRVLKQTWRDLARRVKSSRQKHWDDSTTHWNLTNGDAIQHVTMTDGLPADSSPGRAGQFAVATEPGQAIAGIFPSGIVSHTVSSKSPSRLTSVDVTLRSRSSAEKSPNPDAKSEEPNDRANADPLPDGSISIGADQVLWLQVIGDGGAMSRYVVQDYPRNGTVYPVTQLKPTWRWIRYDLSYWNGDKIHVECSTAGDAPLLAKNNARSWYGIRAAVFAPKSHPSPPTSLNHLAPLFAGDPNAVPENRSALIDHYVSAIRRCLRAWRENQCSDDQALMLDACLRAGLLPNDVEQLPGAAALVAEYQRVENEIPIPTRVPGIDRAVLRRQPLYVRGNHKQPAEFVNPRFLKVIDAIPYAPDQDPRRRLAQDLVRSDNPLTRRVMVNRIWHHLFGSGIVSTPDNFGRLGSRPSHPRLLDHLATQFADDKWSLKKLIRRIVTSRAWQLDSVPQNGVTEKDPENRYLSHSHLRRMTAEAIRDQTLMVSGQLDPQIGGPPVAGNSRRRSVYVRVKRNDLDPLLRVFDFPQPLSSVGRRDVTNVPAQSLAMLNSPDIEQRAHRFAEETRGMNDRKRIESMFVRAFSRRATVDDVKRASAFLQRTRNRAVATRNRVDRIHQQIAVHGQRIDEILTPVRHRLRLERRESSAKTPVPDESKTPLQIPSPIAEWDFVNGPKDQVGTLSLQLKNGAVIENGMLVLRGDGYAISNPLNQDLTEKTLEAWVQLSDLDQRGGGVLSVQTPDGVVFDAIVFGEKDPRQWVSGSNNFTRTQSFDGATKVAPSDSPIHVAMVYHADGRITGYQNGVRYGSDYKSNGPFGFRAGNSILTLGLRHLPAGGNRLLRGRISRVRLYERALSDQAVAESFETKGGISHASVLAALAPNQRQAIESAESQIAALESEIASLGKIDSNPDLLAWRELAHALFMFQEFIYVR